MDSLENAVITDFFQAEEDNNLLRVTELLRQHPELAHVQYEGATALHYAAWAGHQSIAQLLIEAGAELNVRDANHDSSPIGWANESGQTEMIDFLLAAGAQINICQAAAFGKLEIVQRLLQSNPHLIHFQSGWGSPLHEAAGWGHKEIAEYLLAQGADITLTNKQGDTPHDLAKKQQNTASSTPHLPESERNRLAQECGEIAQILEQAGKRP